MEQEATGLVMSKAAGEVLGYGQHWVVKKAKRGELPVAGRTAEGYFLFDLAEMRAIAEQLKAQNRGLPRRGRPRKQAQPGQGQLPLDQHAAASA